MEYSEIAKEVGAIDYNVSLATLELFLEFYGFQIRIPFSYIAEYGEGIIPMIYDSLPYVRWMY